MYIERHTASQTPVFNSLISLILIMNIYRVTDLTSAFDGYNHTMLIKKMKGLGVTDLIAAFDLKLYVS